MQLKMYFFVPFVRPCIHHNYGGISESHAYKDCVWPIMLDAGLYTSALQFFLLWCTLEDALTNSCTLFTLMHPIYLNAPVSPT